MKFQQKLIRGTLIKRYKRFLADIQLETGETITAHTANSGSMLGLIDPGNTVYLSHHDLPHRKLKYSWEMVQVGPTLVGINTSLPNALVEEANQQDLIAELRGYAQLKREVPYGKNSRIDILLSNGDKEKCFVEIKNVTLTKGEIAYFPDAVTARGRKHLEEMMEMVRQGHRAVQFYVLQRNDAHRVSPADHIDPEYGKTLRKAVECGVEVLAYQAEVNVEEIVLRKSIPVTI